MKGWIVASSLVALGACGSSDLDELCRRAEALEAASEVPIAERPARLFEGWEPSSRGGRSILEAMTKDGEIRSAASFRKIVESRTSKAWACPAVDRVLTAPATADAGSLCEASAALDGATVAPGSVGAALARRWTPASAWGRAVSEGIGAKPVEELAALLAERDRDETGLSWSCPALEATIAASRRAEVVRWWELATTVAAGPTGARPVHVRRAKMSQLAGGEIGGDLAGLRARFAAAGEPPCPALEQVLGLGEGGGGEGEGGAGGGGAGGGGAGGEG